jgi:hypothetical protein
LVKAKSDKGDQVFFSVVPVRITKHAVNRYHIEIPKDQIENVKDLIGKDLTMTLKPVDYTKL